MDHLVLHRHAMITIESKSVTGEVHINPQLDFARVFGGKRTGMQSPILQAQRQGALLRQLLVDSKGALRGRTLTSLGDGDWGSYVFEDDELERVTAVLIARHVATPSTQQSSMPSYSCNHCHSAMLEVKYGSSYSFKCLDCKV